MTPAVADRLDAHRHSVDDAARLAPPAPDAPRIVIIPVSYTHLTLPTILRV